MARFTIYQTYNANDRLRTRVLDNATGQDVTDSDGEPVEYMYADSARSKARRLEREQPPA